MKKILINSWIEVIEDFLGNSGLDSRIWRYIDLEKFEYMLRDKSIYFAAATQFDNNDPHEGAINKSMAEQRQAMWGRGKMPLHADMELKRVENLYKTQKKFIKISCWHVSQHESFSMWNYYKGENKGIALVTSIDKLLKYLKQYRAINNGYSEVITVGKVNYIDYLNDKIDSKLGLIAQYFYKRKQYESENELRLLMSLIKLSSYVKVPDCGVNVKFDISKGIDKVVLSPNSTDEDKANAMSLISKYNVSLNVNFSKMDDKPKF